MQRYTFYFIWKLLYMFRAVPSPIIRSANNCIYSIWYLSTKNRIKTKTKNGQFSYTTIQKNRKLTNLLKHTNINIAFKSTNTIRQYTELKTLDKNQDYNMSGIYILTCNTCKIS